MNSTDSSATAMWVLDEGAPVGTADGKFLGHVRRHAHSLSCLVLNKGMFVFGVSWYFVLMTDPGDTTVSLSAQQMVPIMELRSTISEMVREVIAKLRDGGKDDDQDAPPKPSGTFLKRHRSFLPLRDIRRPLVPSCNTCNYNRIDTCMASATCMHWYELYLYIRGWGEPCKFIHRQSPHPYRRREACTSFVSEYSRATD